MDQIGSNPADVCVVLTVTAPGGSHQSLSVQECGCSGQCLPREAVPGRGASELLQVNTGKMFCTALQGMKLLISSLLLPVHSISVAHSSVQTDPVSAVSPD